MLRTIPRIRIVMKIGKIAPTVILLLAFLVQPLYAEEPKETKRVLVLYSETKDLPAHELTDQGIWKAFLSNKVHDVNCIPSTWTCPDSEAQPRCRPRPITCLEDTVT